MVTVSSTFINYFTVADSLYQSSPYSDMREQAPYTKIALGQLFSRQQQMERAKEYFDLALQLSEGQSSNDAKASSLQTIADWLCNMKKFSLAKGIYLQLLRPPLLENASYRMMYIYTGLGDVYQGMNQPDSALFYYKLGMYHAREKGEQYMQDLFYSKMGDAYLNLVISLQQSCTLTVRY